MASMVAFFIFSFVFTFASVVSADPDPLQDICVADYAFGQKVNGYTCKQTIVADDFVSDVISKPGPTNNTYGTAVTAANVLKVPSLNTLGISMSRIDYAPGGLNPPHHHPRASEIIFVLEGELDVGFFTTTNDLISKRIKKGDVFVFPRALVHYQQNVGNTPASVLAAFNSQLPGTQSITATLFGSNPTMSDYLLAKSFHVGTREVQKIKTRLPPKK